MSIDCAFHGWLAGDAEARVSQAGKNWTRFRCGVGKDDTVQWVGVSVFGKAAEAAANLKKFDKVYIEGSIRLDTWQTSDGNERHGLSVAAFKCEKTHNIGRNRPKAEKPKPALQLEQQAGGAAFSDEIPFAPEWRP
jgi:single-stranded DNA-binding protein